MLRVEDLTVEVHGKTVLKDVSLEVPEGEVHVLFGPNGSGKTTLIKTILGFSAYKVVSGRIFFKGRDITDLPTHERVRMGLGVAFQNPPQVRGVKLIDVLRKLDVDGEDVSALLREINLPEEFLKRDLNVGFSGGEVKRTEILQVLAQKPDFVILDEPDSGVDVENMVLIGKALNGFLKQRSGLIVTHMGYIMKYVDADVAHVVLHGTIVCSGHPTKILTQILKEGYRWCERCPERRRCVGR